MRAFLFYEARKQHQFEAMIALSIGLKEHGIIPVIADNMAGCNDCDFVVSWGDRFPSGSPRLILEAGYLNGHSGDYVADRLAFISTGWNGLHGRADAIADCSGDRWDALGVPLAPWRKVGDHVLLIGQHPGDSQCAPQDAWRSLRANIGQYYGDVRYRPHPLVERQEPLAKALSKARLCVTWSSTAAIEAVMLGVPTLTFDIGSMAWPVTSHALGGDLFTGSRQQWANNLAHRQFDMDELANGVAWDCLRSGIEA